MEPVAPNESRSTVRTEPKLNSWLRSILNTTLTYAWRLPSAEGSEDTLSPAVASNPSSASPDSQPKNDDPSAAATTDHHDQLLRIVQALSRLPDDERCVLELHHLHGCSLAEICEQTGRSRLSVAGLLYHGISTLRLLVNDVGADR
jgi:RNA polymerase sigma factor (sigma-70 family)